MENLLLSETRSLHLHVQMVVWLVRGSFPFTPFTHKSQEFKCSVPIQTTWPNQGPIKCQVRAALSQLSCPSSQWSLAEPGFLVGFKETKRKPTIGSKKSFDFVRKGLRLFGKDDFLATSIAI